MKQSYVGTGVLAGLVGGILVALVASSASAHNLTGVNPAARWATGAERSINANLQYPAAVSLRRARDAEVVVQVDADGRLGAPVLTRSSGAPALDEAALDAVRQTRTVGAPPASLAGRPITYRATFEAPETRPTR